MRLAEQMRCGHWLLTHQGVAFDCDGHLIDGHHTLWAVLMSGVTIDLMVTRNLRREAIRVIDTGKSRSLQDRLTLERTWGTVTRAEAACLRRLVRGGARTMKRSPMDEHLDWRRHAKHVRFAIGVTDGLGRGLKIAALRAAIARAHNLADPEALQRFAWEIKNGSGLVESLRGKSDSDTYSITERALWGYLNPGLPIPMGELFP